MSVKFYENKEEFSADVLNIKKQRGIGEIYDCVVVDGVSYLNENLGREPKPFTDLIGYHSPFSKTTLVVDSDGAVLEKDYPEDRFNVEMPTRKQMEDIYNNTKAVVNYMRNDLLELVEENENLAYENKAMGDFLSSELNLTPDEITSRVINDKNGIENSWGTKKLSSLPHSWMLKLWEWEKHTLSTRVFPQAPEGLIAMTELDLRDLGLTEVPLEIGNLVNLTHFWLDGNNLTELPKEIGNLVNLTSLHVSNNKLIKLPLEIGNLTNLTSLWLNRNNLTKLPLEIGKLTNLIDLWLKGNNLTEPPKEIGNLINLTNLDLENNNLTSLPLEIGNLVNLTNLWLKGNNLTETPKEISNLDKLTIFGFDNQRAVEGLSESEPTPSSPSM